jgi:hypothetical protein
VEVVAGHVGGRDEGLCKRGRGEGVTLGAGHLGGWGWVGGWVRWSGCWSESKPPPQTRSPATHAALRTPLAAAAARPGKAAARCWQPRRGREWRYSTPSLHAAMAWGYASCGPTAQSARITAAPPRRVTTRPPHRAAPAPNAPARDAPAPPVPISRFLPAHARHFQCDAARPHLSSPPRPSPPPEPHSRPPHSHPPTPPNTQPRPRPLQLHRWSLQGQCRGGDRAGEHPACVCTCV